MLDRKIRSAEFLLLFVLITCIALLYLPTAHAATKYVDKINGDDANPGNPPTYKTIQKAVDAAVAGDHILVKAGTYNETVSISKSGTQSNPILVEGQLGLNGKRLVTIIPSSRLNAIGSINIVGKDYVTVRNFAIGVGSPAQTTYNEQIKTFYGIRVDSARGITLENNHTRRTQSSGIHAKDSFDIDLGPVHTN